MGLGASIAQVFFTHLSIHGKFGGPVRILKTTIPAINRERAGHGSVDGKVGIHRDGLPNKGIGFLCGGQEVLFGRQFEHSHPAQRDLGNAGQAGPVDRRLP